MHCELKIPDQPWKIDLTRDDFDKFWTIASALQLNETSNEVVWLTILGSSRCWFSLDANVLMWGVVESTESIQQLMVPFAPTALNSVLNFLMTYETCSLTVEVDEIPQTHVAVLQAASGDTLCVNVPVVTQSVPDLAVNGDTSCTLSHEQMHILGDFMRLWPPGVTPDGHDTQFLPAFAHLTIHEEGVRCSMDWSRYGGNLNTVSLAAKGTGTGLIQFDPTVVSRALCRFHEEQEMTVTFHSEGRTSVYFHNDEWGFKVLAGRESVMRWGRSISACIEELDLDGSGSVTVERWGSDENNPTLEFTFGGTTMCISLVSDVRGHDDIIRVALNVANNVVFNLDLMEELNTYNNRTVGVSAVFNCDGVYLVSDVSCAAYKADLPRAIFRLFQRQHDLVAVVAMYGDGATLFDEQGNPTS